MSVINNIKSLFTDDYKAGVESISARPIIYLNPNAFDTNHYEKTGDIHPDDIKKMREMLESQAPGITKKSTDLQIAAIVKESLDTGPFAVRGEHNDKQICIVNEIHDTLNLKTTLLPIIAKTDIEHLKSIPGWEDHWERVIGIHEGAHCNQTSINTSLDTLLHEVEADQAAINWLEASNKHDMAQAWADYRALGAKPRDVDHATGIFLNVGGKNPDGYKEIEAAANFKEEMKLEVMLAYDLDEEEIALLIDEEHDIYLQKVEEVLNAGLLQRPNPMIEEMARNYVDSSKTGVLRDAESDIVTAIKDFQTEMFFEVALVRGIEYEDAVKARKEDPEGFLKTIETSLEIGAFKQPNPYIERFVADYAEGFRKQIVDNKPELPKRYGPRAEINAQPDAHGQKETQPTDATTKPSQTAQTGIPKIDFDTQNSLQIDGQTAGAYFASFADPEMATARLEQKAQAPMLAAQQPQPASSPPQLA